DWAYPAGSDPDPSRGGAGPGIGGYALRASSVHGRLLGTCGEPPSDCDAVLPAHNRGHNTFGHGHIGYTPEPDNDSERKQRTCNRYSPRSRRSMLVPAATYPPLAVASILHCGDKRLARLPILLALYSPPQRRASPANQPTFACSPVKRWLLAMLRMPAVPLTRV